jgi:hypothetical protein
VLPGDLIDDADIAVLEGYGDGPSRASGSKPPLPLSLEVTPSVQSQPVATKDRVLVTSADFLMPYVSAPLLLGFVVLTRSWPFVIGTALFCMACAAPGLRSLAKSRSAVRLLCPVGSAIHADVNAERLTLSARVLTKPREWSG